jgi:hypothetical protein
MEWYWIVLITAGICAAIGLLILNKIFGKGW